MSEAVLRFLERYDCSTPGEYRHALKEVIQELALLGLWRSKFFEHAAFYGGTALRILHALDRFSEDLDFSLLSPNPAFELKTYLHAIQAELASFGLEASVEKEAKAVDSPVLSAFVKANTFKQLLAIEASPSVAAACQLEERLRVRIEIDTDPPPLFSTESKQQLWPVAFAIKAFSKPDLFAGKLHAVLCREWKNRVKGRDWHDMLWFIGRRVPCHLEHLEARMRQSGHYRATPSLTQSQLVELLENKIERLDVAAARRDVTSFLKDRASVKLWSKEFFKEAVSKMETA